MLNSSDEWSEQYFSESKECLIKPMSQAKELQALLGALPNTVVAISNSNGLPCIELTHPGIEGFSTTVSYSRSDIRDAAYTRLFHLWSYEDEEAALPANQELSTSFTSGNFIAPSVLFSDVNGKDDLSALYRVTDKALKGLIPAMRK